MSISHKLRHTFSTLAYEGGATMEQISRALTHSDTKTTPKQEKNTL
ncbi:Hypothetical protein ABNV54_00520 [Enterococcus faecalis]